MSLFLRMWRPLRGWLLTGVDRIEEPDCVLDRARQERREEFQQHCHQAMLAIVQRNQVRRELQQAQKRLAHLEAALRESEKRKDGALCEQLRSEAQSLRDQVARLQSQLLLAERAAEDVKARIQQSEIDIRQRAAERLATTDWSTSQR